MFSAKNVFITGGLPAPSSVCYFIGAAGGGGKDYCTNSGGGGGEYRTGSFSVTAGTSYTITIGGGGTANGGSGNNSSAFCVTSQGGSGNGCSGKKARTGTGGAVGTRATTVYCGTTIIGGGGGGANCTNGNNANVSNVPTCSLAGNGASAPCQNTSWGGFINGVGRFGSGGGGGICDVKSNNYYPGSGNGGSGAGAAYGKRPGCNTPSGSASANSGGGGGGGAGNTYSASGAGGSGVVVIKYPKTYAKAVSTTGSPTIFCCGSNRFYKFKGTGSITW